MSKTILILAGIIAVISAGTAYAAYLALSETPPPESVADSDAAPATPPYTLKVVRCYLDRDIDYTFAEGFITNNEDVTRTYTVTFTLLDGDDDPVALESAYFVRAGPGETVPAEVIFFDPIRFETCRMTVSQS